MAVDARQWPLPVCGKPSMSVKTFSPIVWTLSMVVKTFSLAFGRLSMPVKTFSPFFGRFSRPYNSFPQLVGRLLQGYDTFPQFVERLSMPINRVLHSGEPRKPGFPKSSSSNVLKVFFRQLYRSCIHQLLGEGLRLFCQLLQLLLFGLNLFVSQCCHVTLLQIGFILWFHGFRRFLRPEFSFATF